MQGSLITDMPRDEYVERCKQRAFDYLNRGDLENERWSRCELPRYLATLGRFAANGERCARLEDADRRSEVMVR